LVYLFEKFELDDAEFCLFREGRRVPLEPRALRVLLLFVQNPGKLLQKDFILEAVWKTTFVEESTLTRAVAILRKQLGDDPRAPTYIETVPTLGYRFIAKVETSSNTAAAGTQAEAKTILEVTVVPETYPLVPEAEQNGGNPLQLLQTIPADEALPAGSSTLRQQSRSILRSSWFLLLLLLLAVAGTILWRRSHNRAILEDKKTIVLSDFENSTGDAVFDGTLREGLTVQLEQSPMLTLVPEPRIGNTLRLMSRPADSRLTAGLAREVCQRTDSAAMLDGSIASLGSQYVITLHATNCVTGDILDTEQVQAAKKEDVLRALSTIASNLRGRLGESIASIKSLDTPLDEATTSSLDALKAFSESNRVENQSGSVAAIPLAQRAVELDPKFAVAWAILGRLYGDIGQERSSAESTAKAYEFRDHASDRERFFIVTSYELQVTGNLEKAEQSCETWAQIYPNDAGTYGFRAGLILRVFGQYDKAVANAEHLVAIHPDFALAYHFVALNDIALGRYKEAQQIGERAAARNFKIPYYALDQFRLAFLANDEAAMARAVTMAEKIPGSEDMIAGQQASSFAYHGQLEKAREVSERSINFMRQSGRREAAARSESGAALREAFFGNREQARQLATAALKLSNGRDAEYGAAFALALSENSNQAEALATDLERRFPEDTSVRFHYVPAVRALVALDHHDAAKVIELLQANVTYELGSPQSSFSGFYGVLYPVYVRGLAYLMLHRGDDAATEFRKILDHPGIVANDPIGALARLQLARAYVQSGDRLRARAAYSDFLNLWKGADQGLPVLKQAQLEFDRLEGRIH
jgi:DNA-binding winged helix-turn-helix (wHTH) protein/tetratricopeptide (TPR) repeat protein